MFNVILWLGLEFEFRVFWIVEIEVFRNRRLALVFTRIWAI